MIWHSNQPGRVLGTPGGSLKNSSSWLAGDGGTAKVGLAGERHTASFLATLAAKEGGPTVLHDLRIPIPGIKANIDHIVVSGHTVTIIDSKVWKPGFYWTVGGMTFRGRERFRPAEKKTMPMAQEAIFAHLRKAGVEFRLRRPLLVVWASSGAPSMRLWALRSPGARTTDGGAFALDAHRFAGASSASNDVVSALEQLLIRS